MLTFCHCPVGLFHTFEFGCESGDFVADTAPEDSFARDCPIGRNTCRLSPEPDPIHNFLDYTSDACQYRFTQGQADVMQANVEAYRSGGDDPINLPPVILANGVKSEPYTLVTGRPRFFELPHVSENSTLFCQADADNGILNLFVNWDGSLVDFDCKAESDRTTEECFAYGGPGTLYAMVYAGATVVNFTVECTALDVLNTSALSDSVASAGFNIAAESMQPFTLDTSPETEINEVECSTRADSGQVVLAMGWESDIGRLDCISSNGALTERCQLGPAFAETAYAWAFAVATTSGVSITCRKNSIQAIELFDGTPSTSNSLSENESLLFFLRVDGDSVGFVVCNTEANNGNIDLRMNWDAGFQFDCISQSPSSIESCYIGPDSGLAFIGVVAQETTVDFSLACEFEGPISLANDVKSSQYNVEEDRFRLFTLDVPATSSVHCRTSGRHGDLDLFMNWDGVTGSYLCRSETSSSSEACFLGPGSGTAYAYVYGYEATQRFRITCTIIEG